MKKLTYSLIIVAAIALTFAATNRHAALREGFVNGTADVNSISSLAFVFKVKYKAIEAFQGSITTPVEENFATAGVDYIQLPVSNILQLDKLDDTQFVILQCRANGDLDLWTGGERYL